MPLRKKKTETKSKHSAILRELTACEKRVKYLEAQLEIALETIQKLVDIDCDGTTQN